MDTRLGSIGLEEREMAEVFTILKLADTIRQLAADQAALVVRIEALETEMIALRHLLLNVHNEGED